MILLVYMMEYRKLDLENKLFMINTFRYRKVQQKQLAM